METKQRPASLTSLLTEWRRVAAARTAPGTWHSHVEPYKHWRDVLNWFDKAHAKGLSPTTHFVLCGKPDSDQSGYLVPAVTGNGHGSEANASFISLSDRLIDRLLDVAEAAEARCAAVLPDTREFEDARLRAALDALRGVEDAGPREVGRE